MVRLAHCVNKKAYATAWAAGRVASAGAPDAGYLRVYCCPECGMYHLTSKPPGLYGGADAEVVTSSMIPDRAAEHYRRRKEFWRVVRDGAFGDVVCREHDVVLLRHLMDGKAKIMRYAGGYVEGKSFAATTLPLYVATQILVGCAVYQKGRESCSACGQEVSGNGFRTGKGDRVVISCGSEVCHSQICHGNYNKAV